MVDTPTMPRPSGKLSLWPPAPPALAVLFCVVACLSACKDQCPPLSVQEGEFCRWSRDAGVAGGSGKGGVAAAKAGRNARGGSGGAADSEAAIVWTCEQADSACNCVLAQGSGKDSCTTPKPDCCYVYPEDGNDHCNCVPLNSPACSELFMRPGSGVAATCPL
jgi:hypothetical protein